MNAILLVVLVLLDVVLSEEKLLFVQTVFRHGARAPVKYFTSLKSEKYYFRGLEELTDQGILQANNLGRTLRERYVQTKFLDSRYLPKQASFISSASPRCLQTTQMVGSAMFDPIESGLMVPIAVTSKPKSDDFLLRPKSDCPYQWKYMKRNLKIDVEDYSSGKIWESISKLHSEIALPIGRKSVEPFVTENLANLTLPSWYNSSVDEEVHRLNYLYLNYIMGTGPFLNPEFIKTKSGLLLHTIQTKMELTWKCRAHPDEEECKKFDKTEKFVAYGTHDATLMALSDSLGVTEAAIGPQSNYTLPYYTACFSFELWDKDGRAIVKLLYRKKPETDFFDVSSSIRECSTGECSLETFTECCKAYTTDQPEKICSAIEDCETGGEMELQPVTWVFIVLTIVFFILLCVVLHQCIVLKRYSKNGNQRKDSLTVSA